MTVFAAENVGIVKMIIKVDHNVQIPAGNTQENQDANKTLQNGIAAMTKGEDMGDIEQKLAAMAERAKVQTSTVQKTTTLVTELESYSIQ